MRKDSLFLIMKLVAIVIAAINIAFFSFVLWQYIAISSGALLSIDKFTPLTITILVLDALYTLSIPLYLMLRKR